MKSYLKQPPNGPIYRAPKTSRYGPDRVVGRPATVGNPTVGAAVDRPVDRASETESRLSAGRPPGRLPTIIFLTVGAAVDRSVDRNPGTESRLSASRPVRSTGAFPESRALWTVDRVSRPALQQTVACTSVHVGRPPGRPTSRVGRPSGRPAEAR